MKTVENPDISCVISRIVEQLSFELFTNLASFSQSRYRQMADPLPSELFLFLSQARLERFESSIVESGFADPESLKPWIAKSKKG